MVAYRGLEQALEGMDLPRASTETPREHLARSLVVLSLGGPATAGPLLELADLYQVARFSERPVTADDQRRAAEALGSAHLHLSGAGREGLGQEAVAAEGDGSGTGRAEVGR
jgi:hypothetical protein